MKKKIGRPTDNPKLEKLTVRLDSETSDILAVYCLQESITKAEGLRRGVLKLKEDIKK